MMQGKMKEKLSPKGIFIWCMCAASRLPTSEPRDLRNTFLYAAGFYSNVEIANIINKNFPDLKVELLTSCENNLTTNHKPWDVDNSRSKEVLELKYRSIEESIADTLKRLLDIVA
jgi:hypothetical protein